MIIRLGMRNLWRNKKRSLLASLAIGIGLASLIVFDGFWLGMVDNMIRSVTKTYLGHMQVHQKEYDIAKDPKYLIRDVRNIIKTIEQDHDVDAYSTRVISTGMVSSAFESSNIQIVGIDPAYEKKVSIFSDRILKGTFLKDKNSILIGNKLSQKLDIEIGDRVVVTTSEVQNGNLSQGLFRVIGIYGTGSKALDEYMILIDQSRARELLGLNEGIHEIVINFKDIKNLDSSKLIKKIKKFKGISLKTWKELTPQIMSAISMYDISITIMATILLALVSLGILNTMFMSLYERMFEFGVLRALGTRSFQILLMIMSEAFALAILSIIFGILIGSAFGEYLAIYGVDYSGIEFAEITFTEKIHFIFRWQQFVYFPVVIFIFTILISLYPGIHAIRITMAKALHKSL